MSTPQKPLLLFCATPGDGHVLPVRAVAQTLISRGYEAIFTTNSESKASIEAIGATFVPLTGRADFNMANFHTLFPPPDRAPGAAYSLAHAMKWIFGSTIPYQHESVQEILRSIQQRQAPGRKVIIIQDYTFWGNLPILLGAKGIKPAGVINLGLTPLPLKGPGVPPFGMGLPYDPSPKGIVKNEAMYAGRDERFAELTDGLNGIFANFGVGPMKEHIFDLQVTISDRFLQMCIPSLEYPRPNPPPGLRFTGALPGGHRGVTKEKPSWWEDVAVNAEKKRIVFVTQGTATAQYEKLILPTLKGLAGCEDMLVVAALGREGAVLRSDFKVPKNSRVSDFIPYDELLPYVDVFVTNGGYGGFQHAVSHGTPLIVAGVAADKPEVAARVEWAGLGVNMRTESPTPKAVKEAVEKVLSEGRYKQRARELEEEMGKYDVFGIVEESIKELCAGSV
ncbi:related to N-glycosyltransferase [Rhynchosporium agropyri]|uniref:Related to N-glycosyltransferase n=1 Tax=Rhynchosporium agropyri TaxID=914238 RepID=A0A1E1K9K0_9HELO|nr:related to N-glycosyltransferase [Rhynchosporium agropyri]